MKEVSYTIKQKEVVIEELEGVYFKFPYSETATPPEITKWKNTYYQKTEPKLPDNIQEHFERLPFYKPISKAVDAKQSAKPIGIHKIYYSRLEGHYLIASGQLIVRFKNDFTEEEAQKILKDKRLDVILKLGFAPFLYQVFDPDYRDVVELVNDLARMPECLYAEPSFLRRIGPRS